MQDFSRGWRGVEEVKTDKQNFLISTMGDEQRGLGGRTPSSGHTPDSTFN